ncbi:peptidyl-prolyl cis-trans isomerase D [Bactrocera dorsalis]|uniref:Peptidyl-prolyl cis-trans isomerase D n=1 Tax=Bactrocera dorsalis TaxID=27457 RepID=A0A6I9V995_BACDO|nr:peptidyl-prolyl cis-trans isomerase D [Bactrocera dorsalis]
MSFSDSDDSDSNTTKLTQEEIDANRKLVDPNIDVDFQRDIIGRHQYDRHRRSISRFPDMTELPEPHLATNPIVYFDISVGEEYAGRMIFELRKDIVPMAAENFRALCTGEKGVGKLGKPLHYKGTLMHKIIRTFGCQGGDVVRNNGTCGESIYGPIFETENFTLKHEEGTLSLTNYGKRDTNNSQFVITSNPCYNLDGLNVAFGHVLRGLGVVYNDMERVADIDDTPKEQICILDSGQLMPGEDWGIEDNDETEDFLPQHPRDWDKKYIIYSVDEMVKLLTGIRLAGNYFFKQEKLYDARRKYRKAHRYCNFLRSRGEWEEYPQLKLQEEDFKHLDEFMVLNYINMAAVELKLNNTVFARDACTEAIFLKKDCSKAYYRRAKANCELKDYDGALEDLGMASLLMPANKRIKNDINRTKRLRRAYNLEEAKKYSKLFKYPSEK